MRHGQRHIKELLPGRGLTPKYDSTHVAQVEAEGPFRGIVVFPQELGDAGSVLLVT